MICMLCGYNIKATTEGRCPNCGMIKVNTAFITVNCIRKNANLSRVSRFVCFSCRTRGLVQPNKDSINQICPACASRIEFIIRAPEEGQYISIWR